MTTAGQDLPGAGAGGATSSDAVPAGLRLAGRWLDCYERLAGAAAHELNNALNGVSLNLEVVRLRARPGDDAGRIAAFAEAAVADQAAMTALATALVALARAPRPDAPTDVAETLGHVGAVLTPVLRHQTVALLVDADVTRALTGAEARAVRLAICAGIWEAARSIAGVAAAGRPPSDPPPALRCNLVVTDCPTLVVQPAPAAWADDLRVELAAAGVYTTLAPGELRVAFIPA